MQTVDQFRVWLERQIDSMAAQPDWQEHNWLEAKETLREAYEHAMTLRLPQAEIAGKGGPVRQRLCELLAALPAPAYLTKQQLADALKISTRTVERRLYQGSLPQPTKVGRLVRWSVKDLRDYGVNL